MKIIRPLTPLRQRMLDDLQIRNDSPHTVDAYLRSVAQFAKHFHTAPDRLDAEHVRTYQLHLLHQQASKSIFIQTVCALRFFLRDHPGPSLDGGVDIIGNRSFVLLTLRNPVAKNNSR